MPVTIEITFPDNVVAEARAAFQEELGLDRLANQADFTAWVREKADEVIFRHRERVARATALQNVDRARPTTA